MNKRIVTRSATTMMRKKRMAMPSWQYHRDGGGGVVQ